MEQQEVCAAEEQLGYENKVEPTPAETVTFPSTLSDKTEESVEILEFHRAQVGRDGISFEIITAEASADPYIPKRLLQSVEHRSAKDAITEKLSAAEHRRRRHIEVLRTKAHRSNRKVELVVQRNNDKKSKFVDRSRYNSITRVQECADRRSCYLRNNMRKLRSDAPMEQQNMKMQLKKEVMQMYNSTKLDQMDAMANLMKKCVISTDVEKSSSSKYPTDTVGEKSCEREPGAYQSVKYEVNSHGKTQESENIQRQEGCAQDDKGRQLY